MTLSGKSLGLIALAALVLRIAAMVILQSWEFRDEWAFGYEVGRIGQWLAQGHGFSLDGEAPTAKFPPFYPLVVGAVFSMFGGYSVTSAVILFIFQSICAALAAVFLAIIGNHLFGRTAGLVAGWVWALYPSSFFFSVIRIWYSELAVMLLLLAVVMVIIASGAPTYRQIASLGAISGLAILTDTTLTVYLPLLPLLWLVRHRVPPARSITVVMIWIAAALIIMSPWMIRNWLISGVPMWGKSSFGLELFVGNNDFPLNLNYSDRMRRALQQLDPEELAYYRGQGEHEYSQYLGDKAFEWIWAHPVGFVQNSLIRFAQFWTANPRHGWKAASHLLYYGPLLVLAFIGLWRARDRWRQLAPIWSFLLIYPLPFYLTHMTHGRYRYPIEPFVVLLGAFSLALWLEHRSLLRSRSAGSAPTDAMEGSTS